MLEKEIEKIFTKNKSISLDNLLFNYETFEEVPLFNRYTDIIPFYNYIKPEEMNTFLLNLAYEHLLKLNIHAKKTLPSKKFNEFFSCITYTDSDDEALEKGFYVPNFYITQKNSELNLKEYILSKPKFNLENNNMIKQSLSRLGMIDRINIYHTKWFDNICQDYIQRYYFINTKV